VIVVLVIRPWGDGDVEPPQLLPGTEVEPSGPSASEMATSGNPTTRSTASPADALVETCGSPSGWRAATLQAWPGRSEPIRSWIAVQPVAASGPLDPRIPFVPVATGIVTAVGYCAPSDDTRPPMVARTSLWAVSDGVAAPLTLLPLEPAAPNALGGLWLAPPELDRPSPGATAPSEPTSGDAPRQWPPGRYALQVAAPGGVYNAWLGVEVEDLSPRTIPVPEAGHASPTPSAGP
jgi:hypothetical protein